MTGVVGRYSTRVGARAGALLVVLVAVALGTGVAAAPRAVAAELPGQPTNVTVEPGDRSLAVAWDAAYDGGVPLTGYQVSWMPVGTGATRDTVTTVPGTTLRTTLDGLTNGVQYSVSVCAVNVVGRSLNCDAAPRWMAAGAPGRPEHPTATQLRDGTVRISWSAADAHGAEPTSYRWSAFPGPEEGTLDVASWTAAHPTSGRASYWVDIPDQRPGVDGQYTVSATNQFGSGYEVKVVYRPYWSGELPAGTVLDSGDELHSLNGRYAVVMQADGNLVVYADGTRPLWHSHTWTGYAFVVLQDDGNLVLTRSGLPLWHSGTWGHPASRLVMQDDGNLVLYAADGTPLWSTGWDRGAGAAEDTLWPVQQLTPGQSLISRDRQFRAQMQDDGNLVVYAADGRALWNSWTFSAAWSMDQNRLRLQPDGNLVVYHPNGRAAWHAGTWGNANTRLVMQDDGNLVLYAANGRALWSSRFGRTY